MKIAILGNGKMGQKISEIAIKKGHTILCSTNSKNKAELIDLSIADVGIEFSTPNTAFTNISHAINSGIPVISGTTGWLNKLKEVHLICNRKKGAFLYASNFSIGANLFFELNKKLAHIMKNYNYNSNIYEIHHTEKLDNPSGTAITLKEQIEDILDSNTPIKASRIKDTTGIHQVEYTSEIDEIQIKHTAKNRDGFALGAIMAAEWIIGKQGVFSMHDILSEKKI